MASEMAMTYSEFPLTFLFERQIKGVFMKRFRRVMQKMVKEWMHGYFMEAFRRWNSFVHGHSQFEQQASSTLIQKIVRGYNAKTVVYRKIEQRNVRQERQRFKQLMVARKQWLNAIAIQRVWRGVQARTGTALKEAMQRMKAIVLVQSHWRIKKSNFLYLILSAKRRLDNIAASKIQRIALGYGGRKRAKLRKKIKVMEEREHLLGDRSYVIAQGFRREGACVLLQRWIRHMHGGWTNPHFLGHELMVKPQSLWRGHRDRTSSLLSDLKHQRWMKNVLLLNLTDTVPAANKLAHGWKGRHRRLLFTLMLKVTADHIEALRLKKQEAFAEHVVKAPGLFGKMGLTVNETKE
jgi:hypothetical protein